MDLLKPDPTFNYQSHIAAKGKDLKSALESKQGQLDLGHFKLLSSKLAYEV